MWGRCGWELPHQFGGDGRERHPADRVAEFGGDTLAQRADQDKHLALVLVAEHVLQHPFETLGIVAQSVTILRDEFRKFLARQVVHGMISNSLTLADYRG